MTDIDSDPFARFPTLETERLILRELRDEDLVAAHRMLSDPEVMRYVGKAPHRELSETQAFLTKNRDVFRDRTGVRWAITHRGSGAFIGSCGHWRLIKEHRRSEIGYDLSREHWGQGLMQEALTAVLRFGFTRLDLHSAEAQIDPANDRSRRVLERLGFRQDGLLRENFYFAGQFTDTGVFTLLRREFLSSTPGTANLPRTQSD